ncbi:hypothetical protein N9X24_01100 [Rickettsiales bacterium]|nr:hypothetical protein [Rickettsiales bacterium]
MAIDLDKINPLYSDNLLTTIASELQKEKQDIEELSDILQQLIGEFQGSSKSDISNSVKLKLKLKNIDRNYGNIFFTLIKLSMNGSKNGSFITLDYDKIYYFSNSEQIHDLNLSYTNILKARGDNGEFTEKEFESFIIKCSNIVNEIVSVIIIRPNSDLLIKAVDIMDIEDIS